MVFFKEQMNITALKIVGPFLLLLGLVGYLIPEKLPFISTHPWQNLLHIDLGLIALIIVFWHNATAAKIFNFLTAGLLLYMAVAAWLGIFPNDMFSFTFVDKLINLDLGLLLLFLVVLELVSGGHKKENKHSH